MWLRVNAFLMASSEYFLLFVDESHYDHWLVGERVDTTNT